VEEVLVRGTLKLVQLLLKVQEVQVEEDVDKMQED
jgi:hypothetical protein